MLNDTPSYIQEAIFIRTLEESFFTLYEQGHLNGTIHTCIGQELSALAICGQLGDRDFVFSNHRCHGHFLALTGETKALIAELMGKRSGVCGGVGGSQHLFVKDRFFSNGIQGGIVPVSAGRALAEKLDNTSNIGVVFIGDGTLGQGVVYETLNIISKWDIPLLVVLENNQYAQSTPQAKTLAGGLVRRFEGFGIPCSEATTQDWASLKVSAASTIDKVRETGRPAAQIIHTFRLYPHSKSDDDRDQAEIDAGYKQDFINCYAQEFPEAYASVKSKAESDIQALIEELKAESSMSLEEYRGQEASPKVPEWTPFNPVATQDRTVTSLNKAFHSLMERDDKIVFLGEDIHSPYGGAFKATKGLSDAFPNRVFTTPISEQAIMGISNGLALGGYRPVLEFMFGDFVMLAMDQIINHASKFYHMYNRGISCPVVVRTPMGGHRGYGPTHSQTLDKFLAGADNVCVVALNQFIAPEALYSHILQHEQHPHIVLENKIDYTRRVNPLRHKVLKDYRFSQSDDPFPATRIEPMGGKMDACIVTYGGNVEMVLSAITDLFLEHELLAGAIVMTRIHPMNPEELVINSDRVFVVEEGASSYGFGSEVLALLAEGGAHFASLQRIGSLPLPIPATRELEEEVLVTKEQIVRTIVADF